jgi:hypothetical protein
MGLRLQEIEKSLSTVLIRADGLDQAKHRCPRSLVFGHAYQRLLRPSLHIQILGHKFGHISYILFFAWSFVSIPFLLPVLSRTPAQDDLGPRPFCLQLVCFSFFFGKVFFVLSLPSFFGIVLIIKITCNVLFCWNLLFCFWCPGLGLK